MKPEKKNGMITLKTNMEIKIIINGIERNYEGDYETMHSKNWDVVMQDFLDVIYSQEQNYKDDK